MATPNVVPRPTPVIVGHGEKLEKFNGSDFKHWQQKMLFYLTTLNLAAYLREDIPSLEEGETDCLTVATVEACRLPMQELHPEWFEKYTIQRVLHHSYCQGTLGFFGQEVQDRGCRNQEVRGGEVS